MSYILDALRKAEAERSLGTVPGVHAHAVGVPSPLQPRAPRLRILLLSALGLLLLAAGLLGWLQPWKIPPSGTGAGAAAADTSMASAPVPNAIETARLGGRPGGAAPVAPPGPAAPPALSAAQGSSPAFGSATVPSRNEVPGSRGRSNGGKGRDATTAQGGSPASTPGKDSRTLRQANQAGRAGPGTGSTPIAPAAGSTASPGAGSAALPLSAASPERLPTLRELPENLQREIPPVSINGYIYAADPAERSVLINNRLIREGDQIAPGLMLERMLPGEAVMSYLGKRFRMRYQ